jgi:hypothetical protein
VKTALGGGSLVSLFVGKYASNAKALKDRIKITTAQETVILVHFRDICIRLPYYRFKELHKLVE